MYEKTYEEKKSEDEDEEEEKAEFDSNEGFWRYWLKETIAAGFYCLARRHRL